VTSPSPCPQNTFESDDKKKKRVSNLQSSVAATTAAGNGNAGVPSTPAPQSPSSHQAASPVVAVPKASVNLLDWDDEPQQVAPSQTVAPGGLRLANLELSPADFQQRWGMLPEVLSRQIFTLAMVPDATSEVESSMRDVKVSAPSPLPPFSYLTRPSRSIPWPQALFPLHLG
jgi:hypothetical protein